MPAYLKKTLWAACSLLLTSSGFAQPTPKRLLYIQAQVEPDQELNHFIATEAFKGVHHISTQIRGVRAANEVVYWVSPDGAVVSAYQGEQELWRLNVRHAFQPMVAQAQIRSLVLSQDVLFVSVQPSGFAEVNRHTGKLNYKTIDSNE
jgi:hypothetical protein